MEIEREDHPHGAAVLRLSGHLDDATTAEVASAVRATLDAGQPKIVIDFTRVAYVTSSALAAIMALYGRARSLGGDLVVLNAPKNIEVMLDVLRVSDVVLAEDLDGALEHFAALARDALPADENDSGNPPAR